MGPGGGREDKGSSWRHKRGSTGQPAEPASHTPPYTPGSCLSPELPAVCSTFSGGWLHPELCADQPPPELRGEPTPNLQRDPPGHTCCWFHWLHITSFYLAYYIELECEMILNRLRGSLLLSFKGQTKTTKELTER